MAPDARKIDGGNVLLVDLVVFVGQRAAGHHAGIHKFADDALHESLVGPVVIRVQDELEAGTVIPGIQPEGRVGHEPAGFGPARTVLLHLPAGHGHGRGEGGDIGEVGTGQRGSDDQRVVVDGPHADGIRVPGQSLVEGLRPFDFVVKGSVPVRAGRVHHPPEGIFEIMGGDGSAVAPPRAPAQVEGPARAVGRHLPSIGRRRHEFVVVVQPGEALEGKHRAGRFVDGDPDVERGRLRKVKGIHLLGEGRRIRRHGLADRIDGLRGRVRKRGIVLRDLKDGLRGRPGMGGVILRDLKDRKEEQEKTQQEAGIHAYLPGVVRS